MVLWVKDVRFVVALLLLLNTGCLPEARVDSTKESGAAIAADRLLIIEQMSPTTEVQRGFNRTFPKLLKQCGIRSFLESPPTTLVTSNDQTNIIGPSRKEFQKATAAILQKHQLDTILWVRFISMKQQQRFGVVGAALRYSYELALTTATGKALWHSDIDLLPENISRGNKTASESPVVAGTALAETAFQDMRKDGLFPVCTDASPAPTE